MYQALYRKYRPQTFNDVVGQKSVTETLKNQLITGKLSHAYLFTGSRGTGKTSCAKILAKAVNCLEPVDGNPCNHCAACRSIDNGSCVDVQEIDAASNNGVDNVRGLRDEAVYSPAEVKKRVYIIYEVHMLSVPAFNALLKIIEEPPEHLLFILATTELHKIPATILSRCQRFSFKRLLQEDIAARLNYVAYEEQIDLTEEAASLLARLADGALRDGMSLLDQCATASAGTLTAEKVYECLGLAGLRKTADLLKAAAKHDSGRALAIFSQQYSEGKDVAAMLDEAIALCRDLLILRTAPKSGVGMLSGVCTGKELKELLPLLSPGELLRMIQLLQQTISGFQRSGNRRIDGELCILQMCDPELELDAASLNARLNKLEQMAVTGALKITPTVVSEPEMATEEGDLFDAEDPEEQSQTAEVVAPAADELPLGFWSELTARIKPEVEIAQRGFFTASENSRVKPQLRKDLLQLNTESPFVRDMINSEQTREVIARHASALLKRNVSVRIVVSDGSTEGEDPLDALVRFGKDHREIVRIQDEN